jgi:L-asparaginase II
MNGEPLEVVVTRGAVVEARHRVHAVAVQDGRIVLGSGDVSHVTYMRSSAKPLQALPVVRACAGLDDAEIAIACASHLARPEQLDAVRRLLGRAQASEADLETGPDPTPLEHNCSGKHAGFLVLCLARGWEPSGYSRPEHPCQQELLWVVADAAAVDAGELHTAPDGCGVPTFALPLERMAHAFSRLPSLEGGDRVVGAMSARPDLIRGPEAADVILMQDLSGWAAKGGAEGLMCALSPDGLGIALKVEDGETRAVAAALAEVLRRLGYPVVERLVSTPVKTSRGEVVGAVTVAPFRADEHDVVKR